MEHFKKASPFVGIKDFFFVSFHYIIAICMYVFGVGNKIASDNYYDEMLNNRFLF